MTDTIRQDLRFTVRTLLGRPGVSALVILSLALGIAANTTVFSLVQAVEFPSLIYPQPSSIVFLESRNDVRGLVGMPVSAPDALDITATSRTLTLASLTADQSSILREGRAIRLSGRRTAPSFFQVMRVPASRGRVLMAGDGPGTIVLGDEIWRTAFGSDPSVIGRAIRLDGGLVNVVGVMPPRFDPDSDFWVPLSSTAAFARDDRQFTLFARLAPDATIQLATRELSDHSRRLAGEYPASNRDWITFPTPLRRMHGRESRGVFIMLQAAVAIVLLIACANIANLLLARGTERRQELAIRAALGAGRGRLARGLLIESLLLSSIGGGLGALLSVWGIRLARAIGGFPDVIDPTLNPIVLGFTMAVSIATGLVCGIAPAFRMSGVEPETVLRAGHDRMGSDRTRSWVRSGLVIVQIASALVLATCSTLMLRTLVNRQHVDLGFEPRGAIRADLVLTGDRYRDPASVRAAVNAILGNLASHPEAAAAGVSTWALPTGAGGQRPLTLPRQRDAGLSPAIRRGIEAVTPEYFHAVGTRLALGRSFAETDREGTDQVAIVNEELARQLWPNQNPIGQPLRLGAATEDVPVVTVVGVVGTIRRSAMHDVAVARVYLPYSQYPNANVSITVRARGDVGSLARVLQGAIEATDPALLVEGLRTGEDDVAQFMAPIRLITRLLMGFAITGLLLAGLGVFGTMSYAVSQRQREMAVRAALGAGRGDIFRLVFRAALSITAIGLASGLVSAFAATRALASFLFGVSPTDPLTFVSVAGFLMLVAMAACYRPARVAAHTDPMSLLRV